MPTYSLSPDFDRRLRQRVARWALLLVPLVAVLVALTLSDPPEVRARVLALLVPLVSAAVAYGLWRSYRTQRAAWAGFHLRLDDERFEWRTDARTVAVDRAEVTDARAFRSGIAVAAGGKAVLIPNDVERFDEIRERLGVEPHVSRFGVVSSEAAAAVAVLVLSGVVFLASTPWVIVAAGTVLLAGLAYSMVAVRRASDPALRRRMWWTLLPMVAVGARVAMAALGLL